jgi:hypothetical protein
MKTEDSMSLKRYLNWGLQNTKQQCLPLDRDAFWLSAFLQHLIKNRMLPSQPTVTSLSAVLDTVRRILTHLHFSQPSSFVFRTTKTLYTGNEIWGSHCDEDVEFGITGSNAVWTCNCRHQRFRKKCCHLQGANVDMYPEVYAVSLPRTSTRQPIRRLPPAVTGCGDTKSNQN